MKKENKVITHVHIMNVSRLYSGLLVLLCLLYSLPSVTSSFLLPLTGQQFGVEMNCSVFAEGTKEIVCKINKTAVRNAKCVNDPEYVSLDQIDRNGKETTICQADVRNSATNLLPGSCCCDDSDQEIKICKFSHEFHRSSDEGTRLECKYCTEPQNLDVKDESCRNISFASITSSGAGMIKGTSTWLIGVTFYIACELAGARLGTKGQNSRQHFMMQLRHIDVYV